jgi:hypothetical protein
VFARSIAFAPQSGGNDPDVAAETVCFPLGEENHFHRLAPTGQSAWELSMRAQRLKGAGAALPLPAMAKLERIAPLQPTTKDGRMQFTR